MEASSVGDNSLGRLVTVEYRVPVLCRVDPITGVVDEIAVADEELSEPVAAYDEDGAVLVGQSADEAVRLAEVARRAGWPAWRFAD